MGQVQKNMSPSNQGFRRRTRSVNSIIEQWPIVCGTGSLLEAHLVGRLGLAEALPGLVGCGTNEQEVWQLSTTLERQGGVILSDSIAADRGGALIRRLQQSRVGQRVRLLAQDCRSGDRPDPAFANGTPGPSGAVAGAGSSSRPNQAAPEAMP